MRLNKSKTTLFEGFMHNLNEGSEYELYDEVFWIGAGNEIGATGKIIEFPTEGRMTIKWDDGDVNTYSLNHPNIQKATEYDNSFNECDKQEPEQKSEPKANFKEAYKYSRKKKLTEGTKEKRISHFGEFDNGHVFHKWYEMSDEEAENKAKQMSIEHPDDVWYVAYDDVMNPGSDKRWFRGKEYDSEKGYKIYCQVCRNGFKTKSPEEQSKILSDLGITESDILKEENTIHKVPEDVKEIVENEVYDDRNLNLRSAQFNGNDFVVEPREELNEEIFGKIVDRVTYHFESYGVSYDGIEDYGNKVVASDCYMSEEAYNEYKNNSDDYKPEDEEFYMLNKDTDEKVHVYKDGNRWYDTDGNRYMGYLSKEDVKSYFKGNWTELKEAIEQKYNKSNPDYNRFLNDVKRYTGSYDYLFGGKVDTECYGYPITVKYFYYDRPYVGGGYNLVVNVLTPMDSLAGDGIQEAIDNAFERNSKNKLSQKEIKDKILQTVSSLN